jgi:hypothetical protein
VVVGTYRVAAFAALVGALALAGCADDNAQWFAKPLVKPNQGYTYSQLDEVKLDRMIEAHELVDASGACPSYVPHAAPPQAAADANGAMAPADKAALLGGGVALGMSECDVVSRLGQPTAVNLGANPNGRRSVVIAYNNGSRPGVYRFENGRLAEMDRAEAPPPPPAAPDKKAAKKKPPNPANTATPASTGGDKS